MVEKYPAPACLWSAPPPPFLGDFGAVCICVTLIESLVLTRQEELGSLSKS